MAKATGETIVALVVAIDREEGYVLTDVLDLEFRGLGWNVEWTHTDNAVDARRRIKEAGPFDLLISFADGAPEQPSAITAIHDAKVKSSSTFILAVARSEQKLRAAKSEGADSVITLDKFFDSDRSWNASAVAARISEHVAADRKTRDAGVVSPQDSRGSKAADDNLADVSIEGVVDNVWVNPPTARAPYASRSSFDELLEYFREQPGDPEEIRIGQLTGMDGAGKTYMALRAAAELDHLFPGGIHYAVHPDRGPLARPSGRALLIADQAEGLSADQLQNIVPRGCDLLVVSRTPISGLEGHIFSAATLTAEHMERFVGDLMADAGLEPSYVREIAGRAQGLPLMAYLLVEEAKRRPGDMGWLSDQPTAVQQFLSTFYDRLDEEARALLRRISLLRYDDEVDAASVVLLRVDPRSAASVLDKIRLLLGGTQNLVDRAVREFSAARLREEEPGVIEQLRHDLRLWRAGRYGVSPRTRIARDYWTTIDLLGYRSYADAISAFIRHRDTQPPLTIGIKGPWGSGKTSLMRMVQQELDPKEGDDRRCPIELTTESRRRLRLRRSRTPQANSRLTVGELLRQTEHAYDQRPLLAEVTDHPSRRADWRPTAWFNPWMYQSGEQVWAGFANSIIDQITSRLAVGDRERFWLQLNLSRLDREAIRRSIYRLLLGRLIPPLIGLILAVVAAIPILALRQIPGTLVLAGGSFFFVTSSIMQITRFLHQSVSSTFSRLVSGPTPGLSVNDLTSAATNALRDPDYRAKTGFLHLVQTDMHRVLDLVATPQRPLVLFVDDLDRCSPGTVSQVIEAINLFLAGEFPNCIFVIAMEPEMVAAHVEVAYKELAAALRSRPGSGCSNLGWRFLDKIVQLPIGLPPVEQARHMKPYIQSLLGLPLTSAGNNIQDASSQAQSEGMLSLEGMADVPLRRGEGVRVMGDGESVVGESAVPPKLDPILVDRIEHAVRLRHPDLDELEKIAAAVQAELLGDRSPLREETIVAIDHVFADLYSDAVAWRTVESVLGELSLPNPREIKRYLNLFRFYTFIEHRQRLDGAMAVTPEQIAKLAALVIRWPHILTIVMADRRDGFVLDRLESSVRGDSAVSWDDELHAAGLVSDDYQELKGFLRSGPSIVSASRRLL